MLQVDLQRNFLTAPHQLPGASQQSGQAEEEETDGGSQKAGRWGERVSGRGDTAGRMSVACRALRGGSSSLTGAVGGQEVQAGSENHSPDTHSLRGEHSCEGTQAVGTQSL